VEVGLSPFIRLKQTYKVFSAFCSGPRAGGEKKNGGGNFFGRKTTGKPRQVRRTHPRHAPWTAPHTLQAFVGMGGMPGDNACNAAHLLFLCNKPSSYYCK
jgi:hypothetical protein